MMFRILDGVAIDVEIDAILRKLSNCLLPSHCKDGVLVLPCALRNHGLQQITKVALPRRPEVLMLQSRWNGAAVKCLAWQVPWAKLD